MRSTQILNYVLSLVVVLVLVLLFSDVFDQVPIHARHLHPDRPLPVLTSWVIAHDGLSTYALLTPWLCMVGAPLLTLSASKRYWEPLFFTQRYFAFLSVEALLFLMLSLAAAMPFYDRYITAIQVSNGEVPTNDLIFWGIVGAMVLGAILRVFQIRRPTKTAGSP